MEILVLQDNLIAVLVLTSLDKELSGNIQDILCASHGNKKKSSRFVALCFGELHLMGRFVIELSLHNENYRALKSLGRMCGADADAVILFVVLKLGVFAEAAEVSDELKLRSKHCLCLIFLVRNSDAGLLTGIIHEFQPAAVDLAMINLLKKVMVSGKKIPGVLIVCIGKLLLQVRNRLIKSLATLVVIIHILNGLLISFLAYRINIIAV